MIQSAPSTPFPPARARVVRRRYLIDPKRQLRAVIMTTSLVVILVIMVNLGFGFLRSTQISFISAVAPQLSPLLEEQETFYTLAMVLFSVVLVVAVLLRAIVETHRTVGAVFAVRQRIERVRDGDYNVRLRLRKNDNLEDLVSPFNAMVTALRDKAESEALELERLAVRAEKVESDGRAIAAELRRLARSKHPSVS